MQVEGNVSVMEVHVKKNNTMTEGDIPKITIKPVIEEDKTVTQVEDGAMSVMKVCDASNSEYCDCCSEDEFPPDHYEK